MILLACVLTWVMNAYEGIPLPGLLMLILALLFSIVATLTPDEELRLFEWRRSHTQGSADPVQLAKLGDRQLERAVTALKGVLVLKDR